MIQAAACVLAREACTHHGDTQNLDALRALRLLSIQSNRLRTIEGLDALAALDQLYLSHNGLARLEGLSHTTHLTTLDVGANCIEHIENVAHLSLLEEFWVRAVAVPADVDAGVG
jgi:protein phosphatase 1 regulatory subunit 7